MSRLADPNWNLRGRRRRDEDKYEDEDELPLETSLLKNSMQLLSFLAIEEVVAAIVVLDSTHFHSLNAKKSRMWRHLPLRYQ